MKKLFPTRFFLILALFFSLHANSQVIFSENFTSSSFLTNGWTFPSGQANWTIGAQYTPTGGVTPNAFFNWTPTLTSYSHELLSPLINATAFSGGSVFLSYKFHLNNYSNATVENFAVEYKSAASPSWFTLTTYSSASVSPGLPFNIAPTNVVLPSMAGTNFQIRFRAYGPNSFNINGWGLDNIEVLALNPCTGIPEAGTATALPNNPCPGLPITLDLVNDSIAGGLLYQWQRASSPTGPVWINIGTINPLLYTPPAGSTTFYRCIVSCSSTGFSDTSGVSGGVAVQTFSPTSTCYCTPTNAGSACITNVTFGTLNNTTPGCTGVNNYNFYTTPIPNFVQGSPATFSIATDAGAITSIWIDYNHNTTFETTEWYQVYLNAMSGSITFPIPNTSAIGQTRMRVRSRLTGNQNGAPDACLAMGSGETEDYIINITPAGPFDPTITAIIAPIGNTCTDSFQTLSATVYNYGASNINVTGQPMNVVFTVNGPLGVSTYTVTTPTGVTGPTYPSLSAFGANAFTFTVNNINMYSGGVYTINAKVTCPTLTNASLLNDSLPNAIIITNYRPIAGPPYPLCQYDNTPFGQGLSVNGCTAPIFDSVEINFNLTTCIDNVGALITGIGTGPNDANCNNAYAGNFGNAVLPTLPLGSYFTQKAKLVIDHFTTSFPDEIRFNLYTGSPNPPTLWAGCVSGYPGPVGDSMQVGVTNPPTGFSSNVSYHRLISDGQVADIFDTTKNPSKTLNLGYWESFNDIVALSDITALNTGGTTTAKLKVYYQYVPPAFAWYDVPTSGASLYALSPFDPLSHTNAIVNNSNVPGTYTFYAACLGLTNCRIPVNFVINPTPQVFQDTLLSCEFAVGSNNGVFNLHDADSTVSGGNPNVLVSYRGDQALLSPIAYPSNDTSSTNFIYSVVTYPATGCFSSDSVLLSVNSIPQFSLPIYANGLVCAPSTVDISSVISVFPGTGLDTLFFDDLSYMFPYAGNPHAISIEDTVYMIVVTADSAKCADTSEAQISIGAATNFIANQNLIGNTSIPGFVGCGLVYMSDIDTVTQYTSTDCRRVATLIDSVANGDSLGSVNICQNIDNGIQTHNGQPYVTRVYEITPSNNGSAIVCLYYLQDDFDSYDAAAFPSWPSMVPTTNLCITQVDNGTLGSVGSTAISIPNSAISTSYDASTTIWTVCFPVDSFSYFYCHTCNPANAPLPVQLTDFTGTKINETSLLKWETSSEQNNSHFIVERAKDAKSFLPVSSKIASKGLNGNSSVALKYDYVDTKPLQGYNHYRLQQVDIDGNISYSGTVNVYFGDETMVNLYPNPVTSILNIDIQTPKSTTVFTKIVDATGKIVRTIEMPLQAGSNTNKVDLQSLADGVYLVTVTNNKGIHFAKVISKK